MRETAIDDLPTAPPRSVFSRKVEILKELSLPKGVVITERCEILEEISNSIQANTKSSTLLHWTMLSRSAFRTTGKRLSKRTSVGRSNKPTMSM